MTEVRVASIDIGTVTSRLIMARFEDGRLVSSERRGFVTDLGEKVDAAGRFTEGAIDRVAAACESCVEHAAGYGPQLVTTTLTSAARDAANADALLGRLRGLGLSPCVIPGEAEARITFSGVAQDFPEERIAVADSGGGSTELVVGALEEGVPSIESLRSLDIGCRRVTERFLAPGAAGADAARSWAFDQFSAFWREASGTAAAGACGLPDRLVAVGGTVTTLVALLAELEPYDTSFVHLHALSLAEVDALAERLAVLSVEEIARLKGIDPKRAPVICAGALVVGEMMRAGGYAQLTVSENGMLAGLARTAYAMACQGLPADAVLEALA